MNRSKANLTKSRSPSSKTKRCAQTNEGVITLPGGLLGFEQHKDYVLLGSPEEAPFLWLQMKHEPNLSFLVVSPSEVLDRYQPDLADEDVQFLKLQTPEDALLLNIATVHPDGRATVNLKGPIVVNRRTLVGKQVMPQNAGSFSLQHPLEITAQAAA